MPNAIDTLVEMGFSKMKAELAVSRAGTDDVHLAMDYLLSHDDELERQLANSDVSQSDAPVSETASNSESEASAVTEVAPGAEPTSETDESQVAKSIKCMDCGKLFTSQAEIEFHATKSGHENFSESTEEKKPLTEEEKKEQLAKIEAKLKQRRLEREAREKQEALEREKNRIKSGKEMLEAKKKHDEIEMKKIIEQRKREKEEERLAKQRVREQIEQDKLARKAKFGGGQPAEIEQAAPEPVTKPSAPPKPTGSYSEVRLQIRLTDGTSLTQKFGAKEPLSAVRLYVEMNRTDGQGPFILMMSFPRKVFGPDDYDKPLESLGLAPTATLIVAKS